MTLQRPFNELDNIEGVRRALYNKKRPIRPVSEATAHGLSNMMWTLCNDCWSEVPEDRPDFKKILERVLVPNLTDEIVLDDSIHLVVAKGGFGEIRRGRLKSGVGIALKSLYLRAKPGVVLRVAHQTKVRRISRYLGS